MGHLLHAVADLEREVDFWVQLACLMRDHALAVRRLLAPSSALAVSAPVGGGVSVAVSCSNIQSSSAPLNDTCPPRGNRLPVEAWRALGVLRVPRRGLFRRCSRRRARQWLGYRAALVAADFARAALPAARARERRARERLHGGWAGGAVDDAFAALVAGDPWLQAAVDYNGDLDSFHLDVECEWDPWSRTYVPAPPGGLGWW